MHERVGWVAFHSVCGHGPITIVEDDELVTLAAMCGCGIAVVDREKFHAEWACGPPSQAACGDQMVVPGMSKAMAERASGKPRLVTTWHSVVSMTYGGCITNCEHAHQTQAEAEECAKATGRELLIRRQTDGVVTEGEFMTAAWATAIVEARQDEEVRKFQEAAAGYAVREAERIAQERAKWVGWADGDLSAEVDHRLVLERAASAKAEAAREEWRATMSSVEEVQREQVRRERDE